MPGNLLPGGYKVRTPAFPRGLERLKGCLALLQPHTGPSSFRITSGILVQADPDNHARAPARYGGAQERVGHVDQFLCRAYYARACVESERTRVLKVRFISLAGILR